MTRAGWACHAYGEGPGAHLCFFRESGRLCATELECDRRMVAERRRLYDLIQAQHRADPADPVYAELAEGLTSPDVLLGGPAQDGGGTPSA
jgi:hypothetical protein